MTLFAREHPTDGKCKSISGSPVNVTTPNYRSFKNCEIATVPVGSQDAGATYKERGGESPSQNKGP